VFVWVSAPWHVRSPLRLQFKGWCHRLVRWTERATGNGGQIVGGHRGAKSCFEKTVSQMLFPVVLKDER